MGKEDLKGVYNRAPIFTIENYAYWKYFMYVHLIYVDKLLWVVIEEGPFIPKSIVDGIYVNKAPMIRMMKQLKRHLSILKRRIY